MRPVRARRVQAQRKFAQGALAPTANAIAPTANTTNTPDRREPSLDTQNVFINRIPAATLLDIISFQGVHEHLQPVVVIERLANRNGSCDSNGTRERARHTLTNMKVSSSKTVQPKPPVVRKERKRRDYKRTHLMALRSKRLIRLENNKKVTRSNMKLVQPKRKISAIDAVKHVQRKKKMVCFKDRRLESSDYSLDDNRPLTYFAKCSTPKRPVVSVMPHRNTSPEPVAGPSGLQTTNSIDKNIVSVRPSYYTETKIRRWINSMRTNESPKISKKNQPNPTGENFSKSDDSVVESDDLPAPQPTYCLAKHWISIKDVIDAGRLLNDRCFVCKACDRIDKLTVLSTLLKTQSKFDITGDDHSNTSQEKISAAGGTNNTMVSPEGDDSNLYLELLPKHPAIMIKLRSHMIHGKELLSACLIRRRDARKNTKEFILAEKEDLIDQLIETLTLSLHKGDETRTVKIDSDCNDEYNNTGLGHVKITDVREYRSPTMVESHLHYALEVERQAQIALEAAEEAASEATSMAEVDAQAKALDNEKDANGEGTAATPHIHLDSSSDGEAECESPERAKLFEAPLFRPSKEEFKDPIAYFEKIMPEAYKYGICKIIPPEGWKPKSRIEDNLRFDVFNQYISRMYTRWGPIAREMGAIKLCLRQQNVNFVRPPLLDGVEVNVPRLYHLVQRQGGLETVINKERWGKIAEDMSFNKTPSTEKKLDQIYVKYLLPYDTLAHHERQEIMRKIERTWNRKNQRLLDRSMNPLHRQKVLLGESESSEDETEDEDTAIALADAEDCIIPGVCMTLAKFKKVAANIYQTHLGHRESISGELFSVHNIEDMYWRHVLLGTEHVYVHYATVDTGSVGHGFTNNKKESGGRHPWNLKMLSQNSRNVLRHLGPVLGVTVPTLHLCMLYSTSCWHKDPHCLCWIEYMHNGEGKIWYAVPEEQTDNFRRAVETLVPTSCQNKGLWLSSEIAMIPPNILREHNVSLTRTVQNNGEIVLVFPKTYTCSISTGYNESETVYFALKSWLRNLSAVFQECRDSGEPTMFSLEQLLLRMGRDPSTDLSYLKLIASDIDRIFTEENNNRGKLAARSIKFVYGEETQPFVPRRKRKRCNTAWNVRDQDECEFCRCTLYLSKARGFTGMNSCLCLEHALLVLDNEKYQNISMEYREVFVYVATNELVNVMNTVQDRLRASDS